MKLQTKHIRRILANFKVDLPEQAKISQLKLTHPKNTTSLYSFRLLKQDWAILFDPDADDDKQLIISQFDWPANQIELFSNPNLKSSFGLPFNQKTCYLARKKPTEKRLDLVLKSLYPELSRSKITKLVKQGQVLVDDKIITTASKKVNQQAKIELRLPQKQLKPLPNIEIIYQDDDLIVVNKPTGVLTHSINPAEKTELTLADFIQDKGMFKNPDYRSGIVHRLDRATSGIVILAKNETAEVKLKQQFKQRQVQKTYYAITSGTPKHQQAKIDLPLKRAIKQPGKFCVDPNGKQAISFYRVLKQGNYNLIEIKPKTGRTHQIRVHLSYLNLPIVGDYLYGGQAADRLYLHAKAIEFTNLRGNKIKLETDLPTEFEEWIDKC